MFADAHVKIFSLKHNQTKCFDNTVITVNNNKYISNIRVRSPTFRTVLSDNGDRLPRPLQSRSRLLVRRIPQVHPVYLEQRSPLSARTQMRSSGG